eukprot:556878-Rhodomonas_salina.6
MTLIEETRRATVHRHSEGHGYHRERAQCSAAAQCAITVTLKAQRAGRVSISLSYGSRRSFRLSLALSFSRSRRSAPSSRRRPHPSSLCCTLSICCCAGSRSSNLPLSDSAANLERSSTRSLARSLAADHRQLSPRP